jgi:hypothetical protein
MSASNTKLSPAEVKLFDLAGSVRTKFQATQRQCLTSTCHRLSELFVSAAKEEKFKSLEIVSGFFFSDAKTCHHHTWVIYKNKWIIDLTADQWDEAGALTVLITLLKDSKNVYMPENKVNSDIMKQIIIPCLF